MIDPLETNKIIISFNLHVNLLEDFLKDILFVMSEEDIMRSDIGL